MKTFSSCDLICLISCTPNIATQKQNCIESYLEDFTYLHLEYVLYMPNANIIFDTRKIGLAKVIKAYLCDTNIANYMSFHKSLYCCFYQ